MDILTGFFFCVRERERERERERVSLWHTCSSFFRASAAGWLFSSAQSDRCLDYRKWLFLYRAAFKTLFLLLIECCFFGRCGLVVKIIIAS